MQQKHYIASILQPQVVHFWFCDAFQSSRTCEMFPDVVLVPYPNGRRCGVMLVGAAVTLNPCSRNITLQVLGIKSKTCRDFLSLNLRHVSCFRCPQISAKALRNAIVSQPKANSLFLPFSFDHSLDPGIHLRFTNFKSLTRRWLEENCLFHHSSSFEPIGVSCLTCWQALSRSELGHVASDCGQ